MNKIIVLYVATWFMALFTVASTNELPAQTTSEVSVTTSDGKTLTGDLVAIDESDLHLKEGVKVATLPLADLSRLQFDRSSYPSQPMRLQLSGGSLLSVTAVTWTDQSVTVTPTRQSPLTFPVEQLRWIRFRMGNPATDPTWLGWIEESRRGDRLVVRRNEKALDSIDGTVLGISRKSVRFSMRGNEIEAPLEKLEGVMLSNQGESVSPAAIQLTDASGSVWACESLSLTRGESDLRVTLAGSIEHQIPVSQIREIRFAGGILPLAEAEIATSGYGTETTTSNASAVAIEMKKWFSPATEGGSIQMHVPGEITFRIPDGYQKLVVAARRDTDVNQFMAVRLQVLLDDRVQWSGVLQDRESLGLELPLGDAGRLSLKAAPLPKGDDPKTSTTETLPDLSGTLGGTVEWFSGRLLK
ncbi:glycosyl hydrolase family 98 [Aporhodopirellula aestuarii]|uniref:Glycosyl hydrolase family 98 n=1 Tax=Aporhodopirellula aestuarii TaxID=2950107 RepID=A0ABT0U129_9BACT|nr:glycosyl hydrolase family 98 [Aporhodopirellula aestuarii]MCM2370557.1 glycosyl hydrolase family 98 [Aporhodopirellula aestuarii]